MKFLALKSKKEVDDYFSFDKIQCLICGKWYKALSSHLIAMHETDPDDYRDRFNLPWTRGLVGRETARKQREALQTRVENGDKSVSKTHEEMVRNKCKDHSISREKRDYDLERFLDDGRKFNSLNQKVTKERVSILLSDMKRLNLSRNSIEHGEARSLLGYKPPAIQNHLKMSESLNRDYQDVKKQIRIKIQEDRETLYNKIMSLRGHGSTTREIAKKLAIGATTVKRALRHDDAWKVFS